MKLITETIEDVQVLTEEKNGRKDYKIKVIESKMLKWLRR